jgi:hypothetical protein
MVLLPTVDPASRYRVDRVQLPLLIWLTPRELASMMETFTGVHCKKLF